MRVRVRVRVRVKVRVRVGVSRSIALRTVRALAKKGISLRIAMYSVSASREPGAIWYSSSRHMTSPMWVSSSAE